MPHNNFPKKNQFDLSTEPKFETKIADNFDKFFDDTSDPFGNEKVPKKTNGNDGNNNFDPFGAPVTSSSNKKELTTSGFGFEADFANFDSFETAATNGNGHTWGSGSLDKRNNNFGGKGKNAKDKQVTKISKFAADYTDNDRDLDEVLKRSVMDQ